MMIAEAAHSRVEANHPFFTPPKSFVEKNHALDQLALHTFQKEIEKPRLFHPSYS